MHEFLYIARDVAGKLQRGRLEAESGSALRALLQTRGLRLVGFETQKGTEPLLQDLGWWLNPFRWLPPRSTDIEVALEQLAFMMRSGLGLLKAIKTVGQQTTNRSLRRTCEALERAIEQGSSLADAMEVHRMFPAIAVQLVRVGERTGNLDMVLDRAAKQMAQRRQNLSNVFMALAYPSIVALAAIGVAIYMVVVVIPQLQKFLSAMGRKLPQITQSLLDLASGIQVYGPTVMVFSVAAIVAAVSVYMWSPGRLILDRWLLRIPLIGPILRMSGTVTLASSLSVMMRSGIHLLEALKTAEKIHGNRYLASRVAAAQEAVVYGLGLARPLSLPGAHMPMLASMVAVAEQAGQLDDVLDQVARFYDSQLQSTIKRVSALIEPAIILVVGGIVGYVYVAFFMALFSAGGNFK